MGPIEVIKWGQIRWTKRAEELLIPALAKKMRTSGIMTRDLTESGVSVVNVGGLAQLRYSRIFQRQKEPFMKIPVAIICDLDVREFEKRPKLDTQGRVELNDNGKAIYEYVKLPAESIALLKSQGMEAKAAAFDFHSIKAFVAPYWTLEYSLLKSDSLSEIFAKSFKTVHPTVDESNVEIELARKLINRGLDKTGIAYDLANVLETDNKRAPSQITL